MDPHEDEYDHTGSLRDGHPSEWWQACQACADELNQQETSKEEDSNQRLPSSEIKLINTSLIDPHPDNPRNTSAT